MDWLLSFKRGVETLLYLCIFTSLCLGFGKCSVSEILSNSLYFDSSFLNFSFQWIIVTHVKRIATLVICPYLSTCLPVLLAKQLSLLHFFFHAENIDLETQEWLPVLLCQITHAFETNWQHWSHLLISNFALFLDCASLCCAASKSTRLLWSKFLLC